VGLIRHPARFVIPTARPGEPRRRVVPGSGPRIGTTPVEVWSRGSARMAPPAVGRVASDGHIARAAPHRGSARRAIMREEQA